jgi:hypothetical protein
MNDQLAKLYDSFGIDNPDEPLCAELAERVIWDRKSFPVLSHPLVVVAPYCPGVTDNLYNNLLKDKRTALMRAFADNDWNTYVFLHERPYRLEALIGLKNAGKLNDRTLADLIGQVWTDCESPHVNLDHWIVLFKHVIDPAGLMTDGDREVWSILRDIKSVTVYRGQHVDGKPTGISWTLNRDKAEWFANRWGVDGHVLKRAVPGSRLLAYFSGRGEDEVIILPRGA